MEWDIVTVCPECGCKIADSADVCRYCGKKIVQGSACNKRQAQADLLLKIGALIFIFGLFLPILFVTGGIIFGAGAVVYLLNRR